MDQMKDFYQDLEELRSCAEKIIQKVDSFKNEFLKDEEQTYVEETVYSMEEVRALLAAKAVESDGRFKDQLKAIVKKYGISGSFKDIPSSSYSAVVREVNELKD